MDTLAHGLWGGAAFGRKPNQWKWAFFLGMCPDLFSFGPFFLTHMGDIGERWAHHQFGHPDNRMIPAYVYHAYNVTHSLVIFAILAFVAWKLGPEYKDYVDSRAIPFGPDLFPNLEGLMAAPADSNTWQSTADAYGIHTVVFSLARYDGLVHVFDSLHSYCNSSTWRPL